MDVETLRRIMALRRDVRGHCFDSRDLSEEVIEEILAAALLAPSVGYSQPWRFVVIRDEALRREVRGTFDEENEKAKAMFAGSRGERYRGLKLEGIVEAPINLAVFYEPPGGPVLGQTSSTEFGVYSVVCAVQNMWLMARALNVGIGWVSILDADRVKTILGAPAHFQLVAYLCLGYVKHFDDRPELERLGWESRKRLAEVLHFDRISGG